MTPTPVLPTVCDEVVVDAERIAARVAELGAAIASDHSGDDLRLITVLRGGLIFTADLCRAVDAPLRLDFLAVAPYLHGRGGSVRVTKDLSDPVEDATVILVEDVVDTGLTVNYIHAFIRSHRPRTLKVCALFDKPVRRIADVEISYRGFEMPDRFLVGYGLDVAGLHRNLPFVAALRDEFVFAR